MVDRPLLASEMSSIWCIEDAHPITKFEMSDSESARFDGVVVYEAALTNFERVADSGMYDVSRSVALRHEKPQKALSISESNNERSEHTNWESSHEHDALYRDARS